MKLHRQYEHVDPPPEQQATTSTSVSPSQPEEFVDEYQQNDAGLRSRVRKPLTTYQQSRCHKILKTIAGVAGNVLEWYDFAVFGFFSDIIGTVFFPPKQDGDEEDSIAKSFTVFGAAFLARPVGGLIIGALGDIYGRKFALELSIFLMAGATTFLGCLPSYGHVGDLAILLLILVRLCQGLSVGGQLMSSLVYTLENQPHAQWGLYGSFVMGAANFGTFLGGTVAFCLRGSLTQQQLASWGWRLPFLSGILIAFCGLYLRLYCNDETDDFHHDNVGGGAAIHGPVPTTDDSEHDDNLHASQNSLRSHGGDQSDPPQIPSRVVNPLSLACSRDNIRSLFASALVPMVWSGGFYFSFVWLAIYMTDMVSPPIPASFGIISCNLLLLLLWFPLGGILSDKFGRVLVMTIGGVVFGGLGPLLVIAIESSGGQVWIAFGAQTLLGISLAMWGAPMCAWLVESFDAAARLTSVAIGYNVAQAIAGGFSPIIATLLVEHVDNRTPGFLLFCLSVISLVGLWLVAPHPPERPLPALAERRKNSMIVSTGQSSSIPENIASLELKEFS